MSTDSALMYELRSQKTSLITRWTATVVGVAGLGLIFLSDASAVWGNGLNDTLPLVIRHIGSLLLVTVALTLIWELSAKRSFVDELYSKANIAQSITALGLLNTAFHIGVKR